MIARTSPEELAIMREGGHILATVLDQLVPHATAGTTTLDLDTLAEQLIRSAGALPNFKGYQGFPATICANVNDQVIHGKPNKRALLPGDLLSIDIGLLWQGWNLDMTTSIIIPGKEPDPATARFVSAAWEALNAAIAQARPGGRVGDISAMMQEHIERSGYHPIVEYAGHGVGRQLHMEPSVPCVGRAGRGPELQVGMTLAIEVMMNMGQAAIKTLKDGWTVVTKDGSLSAQVEHTVAITEQGPEILTIVPLKNTSLDATEAGAI